MHLNNIIPDENKRKPIYQIFAGLGLLIGIAQVSFAAANIENPLWLNIVLAVYAFLGGAGFTLANAHTGGSPQINEDDIIFEDDFSAELEVDEVEFPKEFDR